MTSPRVVVVGAGIAGAACARALQQAGVGVEVRERGRAPGGRLAAPTLHERRVDLGAAYFTVKDEQFGEVVADWQARGLARSWTDTMTVLGGDGPGETQGPERFAAPDGLRSLVRDLLAGTQQTLAAEVETIDDLECDAVVLAMPDPQAERLAGSRLGIEWVPYDPVIAIAMGFAQRTWTMPDAAFVNDDADVTLVVDDGSRRGDGAAVLVAHSSADLARTHLGDPDAAIGPVVAAVRRLLDIDAGPDWTTAHRWTFAKPSGTHGDAPFHLSDDGRVGVAGDSWCPSGSPRVEAAWLSGHRLGTRLAARLS